jgi:hypothetical protein
MQLGLYLPGLAALSGVQSLRVPALRGPSLLIVRTRRIFTAGETPTSSAGYSEFPAYSQIYRQHVGLLSHDVLNPARVPL